MNPVSVEYWKGEYILQKKRAEAAEAKAERLANQLAFISRSINDDLAAEVRRQKAEAWDECADVAGDLKVAYGVPFAAELRAMNPYRDEADPNE